jgi:hypothetical protein
VSDSKDLLVCGGRTNIGKDRVSLQFGGEFKFNIKTCICRQVFGLCKTMDEWMSGQ